MKNIVVSEDYKEGDFRPSGLLRKYIELTQEDIQNLLFKHKPLDAQSCPGCQSIRSHPAFSRFGLQYQECRNCRSLFVSPRPQEAELQEFYLRAPSRIFWREEFSRVTQEKREEKIIKPRLQWILESVAEYHSAARYFADVNTLQKGYLEEIAQADIFSRKVLISPFLNSLYSSMILRMSLATCTVLAMLTFFT